MLFRSVLIISCIHLIIAFVNFIKLKDIAKYKKYFNCIYSYLTPHTQKNDFILSIGIEHKYLFKQFILHTIHPQGNLINKLS